MVVYHNPSMGRVIGRPPEWFEGKTPLDLMPAEDAAKAREVLMRLHGRPGAQLPGEFRLRHQDGSWRTVEGVATNLLHDPAVRGIVLNYRDVTAERAQEQRLRDVEQRRQTLLEGIINAEAVQRSRIAEELHDDTIQVMTAAMVELDRCERHLRRGDVGAARRAIAGARDALTTATDRTRRLTFELRPQLLEAAGLGAAVRDLADALHRDTGAEVRVRTRLGRYPIDIETLAYRTVREALINIRKHAPARQRADRHQRAARFAARDHARRRPRVPLPAATVASLDAHRAGDGPRADPVDGRQLRGDLEPGRGHHRRVLAAAAGRVTVSRPGPARWQAAAPPPAPAARSRR